MSLLKRIQYKFAKSKKLSTFARLNVFQRTGFI